MSETSWQCTLPLRPEHVLTEDAARELAELLRDGAIEVPLPKGHPGRGIPVLLGTDSDAPRVGWVKGAEVCLDDPTKVDVELRLEDSDVARSALEQLRSQVYGVGIEGTVKRGTPLPKPGQERVEIDGFLSIRSLNVVHLYDPTRYRGERGTVSETPHG